MPQMGKKYKTLKYSCCQCERESQVKGESSDKDDINSLKDGDAMDDYSEPFEAESSDESDDDSDKSTTEAPSDNKKDKDDADKENERDEDGDAEMPDDCEELSEETIQMMINVFKKAAKFFI